MAKKRYKTEVLTIEGMDELIKNLDSIERHVNKYIENIIKKAAKIIKEDMELRVPRRTEKLAGKIEIEVQEVNILKNEIRIGIGPIGGDVYYWYFIEKGTINMHAQPFVRPAFDNNKEEVEELIKKGLQELLRKVRVYGNQRGFL